MERSKSNTEAKKIKYKKVGGGSLRLARGKIIKPNQIFYAYPHEIGENFKDVVLPMEDVPVQEEEVPEAVVQIYNVKSRGAGGWYDVVDSEDKVLNEKALKRDDAEKFIQELTAE